MTKWRMAEIMGQGHRFGEIFIDTKPARNGPRNLRNLERMGEPRAVVIALMCHENLCFLLQAAKSG